jgi:hypothetical protein
MNSVHGVRLDGVGRNGSESGSESNIGWNKPDQRLGSGHGDTQAQSCQQEDLETVRLN